jgi:hypothetical protein
MFIVLGSAFPLGIGIYTLLMFIGNLVGIRFSLLNESILLFGMVVPLSVLLRHRIKSFVTDCQKSIAKIKLSPIEKIMLAAILFLIGTSFINTLYWPVHIWDSLTLYDIRGKVFAQTGFMKDAWFSSYYWGYPLLTSLAHTVVYLCGGLYPQFLYSLFYLSLGLSFYGGLREFSSRKISMFSLIVLLATQPLFYHSLISYTNLPYTVYLFLGVLSLYLWDKKREMGYLILSALFAGLSTWTRSVEPFWMGLILAVILVSIYRKKIWNILIYLTFLLPIREVWILFQGTLLVPAVSTSSASSSQPNMLIALFDYKRWIEIITFLSKNIIIPWGTIIVAFVLSAIYIFLIKKQKKHFLIYLITLIFLGVLVGGIFIFSLSFKGALNLGDSAERLSMLFYPLFIYCIGLVLYEKNNTTK